MSPFLIFFLLFTNYSFGYRFSILNNRAFYALALGKYDNSRERCRRVFHAHPKQLKLCIKYPPILDAIKKGLDMTTDECRHQFRHKRWNCSGSNFQLSRLQGTKGTREVAFLQALTLAAVNYAVPLHCAKNKHKACSCDRDKYGNFSTDDKGAFRWGGCSLDLKKGRKIANAIANYRRGTDAMALMISHNTRAGRRAVRQHETVACRCHGMSGSCSSRSCWQSLKDFRDLGDYLMDKYEHAVLVTQHQDGSRLVPKANPNGKVNRDDLVYLEGSPDFCSRNPDYAALGTAGRECSEHDTKPNSCNKLCCGQGYDTLEKVVEKACKCTFIYCCKVECSLCKENVTIHTCKPHKRTTDLHDLKRFQP